MKKFFSLTLTGFKSMTGISTFSYNMKSSNKGKLKALLPFIVVACLIPTYVMYIYAVDFFINTLFNLNQISAALTMGIVSLSLIVLLFGIAYIFSLFFASRDIDLLLSIPISGEKIVASKLINACIFEYMFVIPLALPVLIKYALIANANILFWLYGIIIVLILPVIPLCIGAALSLLLSKVINFKGQQDKIQLILTLALMAILLAFTFFTTRLSSLASEVESETQLFTNLILDNMYLVKPMSISYPPSLFATKALVLFNSFEGFVNLAFYVGLSILSFFMCVLLGKYTYISSLLNGKGSSSKKQRMNEEELIKSSKVSKKWFAIFKVDFLILLRTPSYMLNTLLLIPVLPAIFIGTLIAQPESIDMYYQVYSYSPSLFQLGIIAALTLTSGMMAITPTTYSREGRASWITRVVPTSAKEQIIGRSLSAVLVNSLLYLALSALAVYVFKMPLFWILIFSLVSIILSFPIILIGLIIDLVRPMLDWDEEVRAVKQNMNVIFSMLISVIYVGALGLIGYFLNKLNVNVFLIISLGILIALILSYILFVSYKKISKEYFIFS